MKNNDKDYPRNIPVFVYGTLRKGYWNHHLLEDATFLAEGTTCDKYAMYAAGYPMVTREQCEVPIQGELYLVSELELKYLDRLEGYPSHYDREMVPIKCDDECMVKDAWMYFLDAAHERRLDHVPSGDYADYKEKR